MTFDRVSLLIFISDFSPFFSDKDADEGSDKNIINDHYFARFCRRIISSTKQQKRQWKIFLCHYHFPSSKQEQFKIRNLRNDFFFLGEFSSFSFLLFRGAAGSRQKTCWNLIWLQALTFYAAFLWGCEKYSVFARKFFNFNSFSWVCWELREGYGIFSSALK